MLTPLQQSSVRRSFVAARYKSTCHGTKTLRAELPTEQYWDKPAYELQAPHFHLNNQ